MAIFRHERHCARPSGGERRSWFDGRSHGERLESAGCPSGAPPAVHRGLPLEVLSAYDAAPGEKGAILRREGPDSSHVSEWRRAWRPRGAGPARRHPLFAGVARTRHDLDRPRTGWSPTPVESRPGSPRLPAPGWAVRNPAQVHGRGRKARQRTPTGPACCMPRRKLARRCTVRGAVADGFRQEPRPNER